MHRTKQTSRKVVSQPVVRLQESNWLPKGLKKVSSDYRGVKRPHSCRPGIVAYDGTLDNHLSIGTMPKGIHPKDLIYNIMGTLTDNKQKRNSDSFSFEEKSRYFSAQFNKLFGREYVHHILVGGKSVDVLLWRNKKISARVLGAATAVWVLFEWLDYIFLPIFCFGLVACIIGQFIWSHLLNRSIGG